MELYQLQSFLAVARCGSLSRAAISRHISLPGISKHIKTLEDELGVLLFTRSTKGMALTESGRQVLGHAERIEREVIGLRAIARQTTVLRIGLNLAPDFLRLSHLRTLLLEQHPDGEIILTNHNSGNLLKSLQNDELDLCLAFGGIPPQFRTLPVRRVEMILMVPTGLEVADHDLSGQCWIVNTADCPFKAPLEEFWRMHGIAPRSTILSQDLSRRELVAQGLGVGFLEPQDGLILVNSGKGRRHGSFSIDIPLSIVYRDPSFHRDAVLLQRYLQSRYDSLPALEGKIPAVSDVRN